ncbi:unnamed protein product [Dovyalis caffra]|uniref:Uncharacterized protein n=1 Tax=Dovyalis caffra TaxID=77055 RepID=A0AAV1REV8_9ROSI|nr:unnamed protein product [Dovyalis caffra]
MLCIINTSSFDIVDNKFLEADGKIMSTSFELYLDMRINTLWPTPVCIDRDPVVIMWPLELLNSLLNNLLHKKRHCHFHLPSVILLPAKVLDLELGQDFVWISDVVVDDDDDKETIIWWIVIQRAWHRYFLIWPLSSMKLNLLSKAVVRILISTRLALLPI